MILPVPTTQSRYLLHEEEKTLVASVSDPGSYPYHWAGSGSTKGNVDLDPCTKKNRDKLAYKSTKII